jgi:hypothetical protein
MLFDFQKMFMSEKQQQQKKVSSSLEAMDEIEFQSDMNASNHNVLFSV